MTATEILDSDRQKAWAEFLARCPWARQLDHELAQNVFESGYVAGIDRGVELTRGIYQR